MGIQPGSAVDVAAGTYEDPDSAFLLCLIFWRVALLVAGEKSRLDTDSWISDFWFLVFWVFFFQLGTWKLLPSFLLLASLRALKALV